ncbi:MAG: 30S ribosomal protein S9 [Bacteroidia bacterium]|nr:30S ribosomal protein S9 [Bacteroidia bacterium]MCX7651905.1 30S ribosomal protein S9 [Bacteroidia bacterium]MDW8416056.1 30S ribosomal protein S9 [Bacteroidia bacterium]
MNATLHTYIHAVGRRKTSVVRLYLRPGNGTFLVNRRPWKEYFSSEIYQLEILRPFEVLGLEPQKYDIIVYADGGGVKGQAEALRLAIARALLRENDSRRAFLRKAGLLTVDSRQVERKHYGHKKARKSFQFSKR